MRRRIHGADRDSKVSCKPCPTRGLNAGFDTSRFVGVGSGGNAGDRGKRADCDALARHSPADRLLARLDVDLGPDVSLGSFAGANAILSPDGTLD
jgi:hypothetical protein